MSMISSKLDAVSRNSIWDEHVRKETRNLKLNDTFTLARRVDLLPEKPNRTIPTSNPDKATVAEAAAIINRLSTLKETDKLPTERYALPVTGSMEYGFWLQNKAPVHLQFQHPIKCCDVTNYAALYTTSNGTSPFMRKA